MRYYVTMAIEGRFTCGVEANGLDEAKEKAIEEYYDADFGVLECIEAQVVNAEDENGNLHDYQ